MTDVVTEETFLSDRIGQPTKVYLINGVALDGWLAGSDTHAVFLRCRNGSTMMVMKTAISTVT